MIALNVFDVFLILSSVSLGHAFEAFSPTFSSVVKEKDVDRYVIATVYVLTRFDKTQSKLPNSLRYL